MDWDGRAHRNGIIQVQSLGINMHLGNIRMDERDPLSRHSRNASCTICFLLCVAALILLLFTSGPLCICLLKPDDVQSFAALVHTQIHALVKLSLVSACMVYKKCLSL